MWQNIVLKTLQCCSTVVERNLSSSRRECRGSTIKYSFIDIVAPHLKKFSTSRKCESERRMSRIHHEYSLFDLIIIIVQSYPRKKAKIVSMLSYDTIFFKKIQGSIFHQKTISYDTEKFFSSNHVRYYALHWRFSTSLALDTPIPF